jgi:hypothetical protein
MTYMRVKWKHSLNSEPQLIYSELDDQRWELRKVEVYADGHAGYASSSESRGGSGLSKEPLPSLEEIASDAQFEPVEVDQAEFERMWAKAHN